MHVMTQSRGMRPLLESSGRQSAPIGEVAQLRFGVGWEVLEKALEELATKLETDDPASVVGHFAPGRLQQIAAAVEKLPALLERLKPELEKRLMARQKPPGPTVH
jgi:hypothetical protein